MSENLETAKLFIEASETGKGWDGCSEYCHPNATFSAQAGALADINDLNAYTEWTKGLLTPMPDGRYELRFIAEDNDNSRVIAYAVFYGTHTGQGGPADPTGKSVESDYVYAMQFEDGRIRHITKIWNDSICLQQLGWA